MFLNVEAKGVLLWRSRPKLYLPEGRGQNCIFPMVEAKDLSLWRSRPVAKAYFCEGRGQRHNYLPEGQGQRQYFWRSRPKVYFPEGRGQRRISLKGQIQRRIFLKVEVKMLSSWRSRPKVYLPEGKGQRYLFLKAEAKGVSAWRLRLNVFLNEGRGQGPFDFVLFWMSKTKQRPWPPWRNPGDDSTLCSQSFREPIHASERCSHDQRMYDNDVSTLT